MKGPLVAGAAHSRSNFPAIPDFARARSEPLQRHDGFLPVYDLGGTGRGRDRRGLTAIYSSSLWVLIAAALIGAYLGSEGEQLGRAIFSNIWRRGVVRGGVGAGQRSPPS
jgi:hypothetical protein